MVQVQSKKVGIAGPANETSTEMTDGRQSMRVTMGPGLLWQNHQEVVVLILRRMKRRNIGNSAAGSQDHIPTLLICPCRYSGVSIIYSSWLNKRVPPSMMERDGSEGADLDCALWG